MDKKAINWNDVNINKKNVVLFVVALAASMISLFYLRNTSGTYPVHVMMAIFCLGLFAYNTVKGYGISEGDKCITILISLIYACSITFANYALWTNWGGLGFFIFAIMFCVSFFQFVNLCVFVQNKLQGFFWKESGEKQYKGVVVFAVVFGMITVVDMLYLFGYGYPGTVTADSLWQIQQAIDHSYFNHHPFWHTMFIRLCIKAGGKIFGTVNGGVAVYSICQILLVAFSFAYAYLTIYQMNVKKGVRYLILFWYVCMPFHIAFSTTMWKDIFFGAAVLVYSTALIRILYGIGKNKLLNYGIFSISTIGFIIFRSNGWIALAMAIVLFALFFRKQMKTVIIIMAVFLVAVKLINIPVFEHFNVTETDIVESISIPVQQIGRVAVDGGKIEGEDRELLETVVDVDQLADLYLSNLSDPIKEAIYLQGNSHYIVENKFGFLKTWMSIGIKNPASYCKAWVDQTRGYWTCGGESTGWSNGITANEYDMHEEVKIGALSSLWEGYLTFFEEIPILKPILNIGVYVWLLVLLGIIGIKDNFKRVIPFIPVFAIWFTLLIATPLNGEFRYMYSFFTSLPIIAVSVFCKMKQD